jgi:hypothetical protein
MSTVNVTGLNENIPVYGGVNETINVHGLAVFSLPVGGIHSPNITVNLGSFDGTWLGGFTQAPGSHLTITSGGQFASQEGFTASGPSTANGSTYIGANVFGLGTSSINEFQTHSKGKLEFAHSVEGSITVTDSGSGGSRGVVQIDNPAQYSAATQLGFGEIILEGLKATSYSLKNDLLSIFNGSRIIDTLNLSVQSVGGSAPERFGVSQVGGSVVIHADGQAYHDGGKLLAMHG